MFVAKSDAYDDVRKVQLHVLYRGYQQHEQMATVYEKCLVLLHSLLK